MPGQVVPLPDPPSSADTVVLAVGSATVFGGNVETARRAALQSAYAEAVGRASGVEVGRMTIVRNVKAVSDIVATRSRGFIKSYEILSERLSPGDRPVIEVSIRATVTTRESNAAEDIEGLRLFLDLIGRPTILILLPDAELPDTTTTDSVRVTGDERSVTIVERHDDRSRPGTKGLTALGPDTQGAGTIRAAEAAVAQALSTYGYPVLTSDDLAADDRITATQIDAARRGVTTAARAVARTVGADLLLSGMLRVSTQRVMPHGVEFVSATTAASAKAMVTSNGAVVDAFHRTVTKAHPSALGALSMTLDAVAEELAGTLAWKIPAILAAQPRVTRVVVDNISFETAQRLRDAFERLPGVDAVRFVVIPTAARRRVEFDLLSGYVPISVEELIDACIIAAGGGTCRIDNANKFETVFTLLTR